MEFGHIPNGGDEVDWEAPPGKMQRKGWMYE